LWVAATGELQIQKEEAKGNKNKDLDEIRLLSAYTGRTYMDQGIYERAEPLLRKALRISESKDKNSSNFATDLNNLAELLHYQVRKYLSNGAWK
jgi:hypothetical protein